MGKISTRGIKELIKKGVPFQVVQYEHEEKGAAFASQAIHFPLERTIKTLVVDTGKTGYLLALVPGARTLNLKRLAKILQVKRVQMADTPTAQRVTGYLVGGISPFATRTELRTIMEKELLNFDKVAINAGKRGTMVIMSPIDIVSVTGCELEHIVH